MKIKSVSIINAQGVKSYSIGDIVNDKKIHTIEICQMHFTGDPYDHFVGKDDSGNFLFSINCLIPCQIEYIPLLPGF